MVTLQSTVYCRHNIHLIGRHAKRLRLYCVKHFQKLGLQGLFAFLNPIPKACIGWIMCYPIDIQLTTRFAQQGSYNVREVSAPSGVIHWLHNSCIDFYWSVTTGDL